MTKRIYQMKKVISMTLTIEISSELEAVLREQAAREQIELQQLVIRAVEECVGKSKSTAPIPSAIQLTAKEAELLSEINQGMPENEWRRYHHLIAQRNTGALTPQEHEELKSLTDTIELAHARRLEKLVELSELRKTPLEELMDELGIRGPGYV